jgi:hypothetical protein
MGFIRVSKTKVMLSFIRVVVAYKGNQTGSMLLISVILKFWALHRSSSSILY